MGLDQRLGRKKIKHGVRRGPVRTSLVQQSRDGGLCSNQTHKTKKQPVRKFLAKDFYKQIIVTLYCIYWDFS